MFIALLLSRHASQVFWKDNFNLFFFSFSLCNTLKLFEDIISFIIIFSPRWKEPQEIIFSILFCSPLSVFSFLLCLYINVQISRFFSQSISISLCRRAAQEYIRRQLEEEQRQLEILQQQLLQEQALLLVTTALPRATTAPQLCCVIPVPTACTWMEYIFFGLLATDLSKNIFLWNWFGSLNACAVSFSWLDLKGFYRKKDFCFDCPVMSCKENVGHCCFPQCPALFLRVFPFSICILHHSCTLELKIEDWQVWKETFWDPKATKMTLVPKSSAVLRHYSCAHRSNTYIPLPCFSCRFCLVFCQSYM